MRVSNITGYRHQASNIKFNFNVNFASSKKEALKRDVFERRKEDEFGGNVFQFGTLEEIKKASEDLTREEVIKGIFSGNITGANAIILAEKDPERIRLLCSYLEPKEVAAVSLSFDGYRRTPFLDFKGESFKALMEKVTEKDTKQLILCTKKDDDTNCLYTFEPDKIKTLFDNMDKKDVKELCMQQEAYYGNTPFHMQSNEAFEVLCQSLEPEDLEDVISIGNAYGLTIKDTLKNNEEKMQIYKKYTGK